MSRVVLVARAALSGLGRGSLAASAGEAGESARIATVVDEELSSAGLARPFAARVAGLPALGDRATSLLRAAFVDLRASLDRESPGWADRRVGVALATSSGGMRSAEELFRVLHDDGAPSAALARDAQYFSPVDAVLAEQPFDAKPFTLVLTACAASTIALGVAQAWLRAGACDVAIAGGFDAVSVFVASGFEALRATTASLPSRPFAKTRDGMVLGEGAALLALMRESDADGIRKTARIYLDGFGTSGDAVHVTAPDRTGDGLTRAALAALGDAPLDAVELVSAHGTATPFNDAAESRAIARVVPHPVVVHPFKAQIGHTLGAAGALESLAAIDAIERGVVPASVCEGERDPDAPATLLPVAERRPIDAALKLSAAFGGSNASIVWSSRPLRTPLPDSRDVFVSRAVALDAVPRVADLAALVGQPAEKLARADAPCFLALGALAELRGLGIDLSGAGIVVGHSYATLDVNEQYNRRILDRGARLVEPRRFPYTSPNGVAGECSLAFKLTGPNLAVGVGLDGAIEALAVAADLVRGSHCDRIVVVAVDAPGPAATASTTATGWPLPRTGAVAMLVSSAREGEGTRRLVEAWVSSRGATPDTPLAAGHESLLPLLMPVMPSIRVRTPGGGAGFVLLER